MKLKKNKAVIGLIGLGDHSRKQHLPNLLRAPHILLKSICDLDEQILKKVQKKYNISNSTTDYKDLYDDPEIDAVVISTKEDTQAKLTVEALNAGKYVYVEKPLANTVEECRLVVEAEKKSGKFACVGYNRRRAPAYLKAKELLLKNGGAKNIYYRISDEYWDWGRFYPPGTRIIHELCHIFDIIRWFTESEIVSIYCLESRKDDNAFLLQTDSGCIVSIIDSGHVTMDLPKERVEIITERGAIIVEEFVELRTFGYKDADPIYRFSGHTHPDNEFMYKFLLEKCGSESLFAIRRALWELHQKYNEKEITKDSSDQAELEIFIKERAPVVNYIVNKGWLEAVDHFAEHVLAGTLPSLATAEDGLKASILSHCAMKSRDCSTVVKVP